VRGRSAQAMYCAPAIYSTVHEIQTSLTTLGGSSLPGDSGIDSLDLARAFVRARREVYRDEVPRAVSGI
jgi:hypothetical protein